MEYFLLEPSLPTLLFYQKLPVVGESQQMGKHMSFWAVILQHFTTTCFILYWYTRMGAGSWNTSHSFSSKTLLMWCCPLNCSVRHSAHVEGHGASRGLCSRSPTFRSKAGAIGEWDGSPFLLFFCGRYYVAAATLYSYLRIIKKNCTKGDIFLFGSYDLLQGDSLHTEKK